MNLAARVHYLRPSPARLLTSGQSVIIFCAVPVKERLAILEGYDGAVWLHRSSGYMRWPHRHDELEINLVVRGTASYLLANARYDLRCDAQTWFFPAQEHILLNASPDFTMWIAVFRPELVARLCNGDETRILREPDPPGQFCRRLRRSRAAWLCALLAGLADDYGADAARFNAGLGYALLSAWRAHLEALNVRGQDVPPAVEAAARALREEDPSRPWTLAALGRHCGVSPSHLSRLFARHTGVSIVEFRNRQRVERFLALYGSGHRYTLRGAALAAGFGSYAQFHRIFRRMMGCGPAAYCRQTRDQGL